jgi:ribulose-5-phosphate 4-epimerase/fuculose-1-phosphate aldolase
LSVRLDGQLLLVTPTSVSKGMLRLQDLIVVDKGGAFRDDFTRYETARTRALAKRRGNGTAERATAAQI